VVLHPTQPDQLIKLALDAIEETTAAAHVDPVPKTGGLALVFDWLRQLGIDGEPLPRRPFENV